MDKQQIFTDQGINVTKRIQEGKTFLFTCDDSLKEANKKANEIRSYPYEAYSFNEFGKKVMIGYAVPK